MWLRDPCRGRALGVLEQTSSRPIAQRRILRPRGEVAKPKIDW